MASDEQGPEQAIYFERQTRFLCGLHVLNNLLGKAEFTVGDLDAFASTTGTGSVFGYYDLNVLQLAADSRGYDISFFDARKHVDELPLDDDSVVGILINITTPLMYFWKSKHWICIRKVSTEEEKRHQWYYLDSKAKRPEFVETQHVGPRAAQLRNHGALILIVTRKPAQIENAALTQEKEPVEE